MWHLQLITIHPCQKTYLYSTKSRVLKQMPCWPTLRASPVGAGTSRCKSECWYSNSNPKNLPWQECGSCNKVNRSRLFVVSNDFMTVAFFAHAGFIAKERKKKKVLSYNWAESFTLQSRKVQSLSGCKITDSEMEDGDGIHPWCIEHYLRSIYMYIHWWTLHLWLTVCPYIRGSREVF